MKSYKIDQVLVFILCVVIGLIAYPAFINSTATAPTNDVLGEAGYQKAQFTIYVGGAVMGSIGYLVVNVSRYFSRTRNRRNAQSGAQGKDGRGAFQ